jgi:hypothetical protein
VLEGEAVEEMGKVEREGAVAREAEDNKVREEASSRSSLEVLAAEKSTGKEVACEDR